MTPPRSEVTALAGAVTSTTRTLTPKHSTQAPRRYNGAWAGIEQDELIALVVRLKARMSHVAMFVAIRVRSDADGVTRDGFRSLSKYAGNMSADAADAALKWLVAHRVIGVRKYPKGRRPRVQRGDPGQAYVADERWIRPHGEWEDAPTTGAPSDEEDVPVSQRGRSGFGREDAPTTGAHQEDVAQETSLDDDEVHEEDARVVGALAVLAGVPGYRFDAGRDREALERLRRERPLVDIEAETKRWKAECIAGRTRRISLASLMGWLGAADETFVLCEVAGCSKEGSTFGSFRRCFTHRPSADEQDARERARAEAESIRLGVGPHCASCHDRKVEHRHDGTCASCDRCTGFRPLEVVSGATVAASSERAA